MLPARVHVVFVAIGDAPDEYVSKMASMLTRFMPVPFDLTCVVDRPRDFSDAIVQIDASGWTPPREGMRATTYKLGLYDREKIPYDEFLYLDSTAVIQKDMTPLLEFAFGAPQPLVMVKDWNYDTFNSCVMRIRPGGDLAEIPKAYANGVTYTQRVPGDQDFATGVLRERGWQDRVVTFPEGMIQSYTVARMAAKRGHRIGKAMLEEAIVVKFNGQPKMDQLLDWRYRVAQMIDKGNPWHRNAWFWVRELRERWR